MHKPMKIHHGETLVLTADAVDDGGAEVPIGAGWQGIALTATRADCVALLTAGDISSDAWQVACARLGLQQVAQEIDG